MSNGPYKPKKKKIVPVEEAIKPTIKELSVKPNTGGPASNLNVSASAVDNDAKLDSLLKKRAISEVIKKGAKNILKGATRMNVLSLLFSAKSAAADPVVDPETGINRFTGKTVYTPIKFN